jgi:hypothetical protein
LRSGERIKGELWVTFNTTGEIRLTTDAADVAGAAGSNMLLLGINDDHLVDNSGEFRVQVRGGGR